MRNWIAATVCAACVHTPLFAQPVDVASAGISPERSYYEGHAAVRIYPQTPRDSLVLGAMESGLTLVSEGFGQGQVDAIATPEAINALRELGIEFDVLHENVQQIVDAESQRLAAGRLNNQARGADPLANYFDDYRPFQDLPGAPTAAVDSADEFIDELAAQYPSLITVSEIGTSIEGRTIRAMTISGSGDPSTKPALCFNSGAHSREWIAPMTLNYIAHQLVEGYGNDQRITDLLDNLTFYIIPVIQPDGNMYSWTDERYWRKNRRDNGNGTFGVDWNRNFDSNFGGAGSSSSTNSDTYHGPFAFSEPETQALRDFFFAHPNIVSHIDFHSFSQLILWPYGYDFIQAPEPDRTTFQMLSNQMSNEMLNSGGTSYTAQPAYDLYLASGTSNDWAYSATGALSWTFELRPASGGLSGFSPSASLILPTAQENLAAILLLGDAIADGVSFIYPRGVPDVTSAGNPETFRLIVSPIISGELDPSTATLWYNTSPTVGYQPVQMNWLGNSLYEATFPVTDCGQEISYYISIDSVSGETYTNPRNAPAEVYAAQTLDLTVSFQDDFETDQGWTTSSDAGTGAWERGIPANGDRGDPATDADGSGQCFLTGNAVGDTDIDDGTVTLVSPVIDISEGGLVEYAYWINNNGATWDFFDFLAMDVSTDGGQNWSRRRVYQSPEDAWRTDTFDVGTDIAATSQMRFRFVATDMSGGSIVEAGLDAFKVTRSVPCECPADVNGDGEATPADFTAWLSAFNNPLDPNRDRADVNGDGDVDPADFTAWLAAFNDGC